MSEEQSKPVMVEYQGKMVPATPIEIMHSVQTPNLYLLKDGAKLHIAVTMQHLYTIDNAVADDGTPVFHFQFSIHTIYQHGKKEVQP